MTEFEKMRSQQLTDMTDAAIQASFIHAKEILVKMQTMTFYHPDYRGLVEQLIPGVPESAILTPPFYCDHGNGITLGEGVYINANCTFLDGGQITIGARTLIGPNVQIYTPHHPMNYVERRKPIETAYPVTIGEDCWLGGGVVVTPGVTIGNRCVIGAGSVVTKDLPDDVVAVGNPARIIKKAE